MPSCLCGGRTRSCTESARCVGDAPRRFPDRPRPGGPADAYRRRAGRRRGDHRTVTAGRAHGAPRHPDLVKRGWSTPTKPDTWWLADFTYVWTLTGFVYVSFITDVSSRRILGWRVMSRKETALVSSAVEQALAIRRRHDEPSRVSCRLPV